MFRLNYGSILSALTAHRSILLLSLILVNLAFNVLSNAGFKLSAQSSSLKQFISWQVVGNLAGFITVLALTGLLVYIPLHIAFPVTTGLAVIGVQLVSGRLFFHEAISPEQWLGALFVVIGIVFLTWR